MVLLLERFYQGQLLSESSTRYLLKVMKETTTGPNRLKAGLPSGTLLAHKTGTAGDSVAINGATNDVGVAKLPDGAEVIIAVFIKGSDASSKNREAAIAEVARNVVKTRYRPLKAAGFRITLFEGTAATGSGECLVRKGCTSFLRDIPQHPLKVGKVRYLVGNGRRSVPCWGLSYWKISATIGTGNATASVPYWNSELTPSLQKWESLSYPDGEAGAFLVPTTPGVCFERIKEVSMELQELIPMLTIENLFR